MIKGKKIIKISFSYLGSISNDYLDKVFIINCEDIIYRIKIMYEDFAITEHHLSWNLKKINYEIYFYFLLF